MSNNVTFTEFYGEVTPSLLRTIKRFNVSPADFSELEMYSEDLFASKLAQLNAIERVIKLNARDRRYEAPWPLSREVFQNI